MKTTTNSGYGITYSCLSVGRNHLHFIFFAMTLFPCLSFMSRSALLVVMLLGYPLLSQAQDDPYYQALRQQLQTEYEVSGGTWLVGGDETSILSNRGYGAEVSEVAVEGQPFGGALRVKLTDFGPNPFDQGIIFESQQAVAQGDVVLLAFYLRSVSDEVVRIGAVVEGGVSGNRSLDQVIRIASSEWEQIILPAEVIADHPADQFRLQINLGYLAQEFEIGGIALLNYGDAYTTQQLPSVLPALTYEGIAPDAPWRAAAQQRIEENRKGDLTVLVVDQAGTPVPDAQVQVSMTQHAFGFGTAVSATRLAGFTNEEDITSYRERLYDLTGDGRTFNVTTAENALKWPNWEGTAAKNQIVGVLDDLRERGMQQRGHALVWGGSRFLPTDIVAELDKDTPDVALIQQRIRDRITEAMQYPGLDGEITEWDVANEPLHENRLYDALIGTNGYTSQADIIADWLRQARIADPEAELFLNEYDIWNNSPFYISEYKKLAEAILAQGAPLDGLGIQAHMGAILPPIETLYAILDELAATGLDLSIAEFDAAGVTDDSVAAAFLRDAMTIAFSHPAVTDFLMWGFWDKIHWLT